MDQQGRKREGCNGIGLSWQGQMVKSSRRLVRRAHTKDSKASSAAEARHASSSARSRGAKRRWTVCGSGLKTTVQGKFPGLGHKIGGASDAARLLRQSACGAIAKLVSRRSKVVKAACPSDAPTKR